MGRSNQVSYKLCMIHIYSAVFFPHGHSMHGHSINKLEAEYQGYMIMLIIFCFPWYIS